MKNEAQNDQNDIAEQELQRRIEALDTFADCIITPESVQMEEYLECERVLRDCNLA